MNTDTLLAVLVNLVLAAALVALLQRTHRRSVVAGGHRAPWTYMQRRAYALTPGSDPRE